MSCNISTTLTEYKVEIVRMSKSLEYHQRFDKKQIKVLGWWDVKTFVHARHGQLDVLVGTHGQPVSWYETNIELAVHQFPRVEGEEHRSWAVSCSCSVGTWDRILTLLSSAFPSKLENPFAGRPSVARPSSAYPSLTYVDRSRPCYLPSL